MCAVTVCDGDERNNMEMELNGYRLTSTGFADTILTCSNRTLELTCKVSFGLWHGSKGLWFVDSATRFPGRPLEMGAGGPPST